MIIKPLTTEKAIRLIELNNTLVFKVDKRNNRKEIAKEVEDRFKVKVKKINILNRGTDKIAYVTLKKENPAIDVATKLGVI